MPEITVASTTDTQDDINNAAGLEQQEQETKPEVSAQPETEQQAEPEAEVVRKPSKSANQKRYDALTRKIKDLEAQIGAKSAAPPTTEETPTVTAPEFQPSTPRPERANFGSDDEFIDALTDWKLDQREAKQAFEAQQRAAQEHQKEVVTAFLKTADEVIAKYPDYNEVLSATIPLWTGVREAILELENGPYVAYYLGKHPDIAQKLMEMTPQKAMAEVGRLSLQIGDEISETPDTEREEDEQEDELPVAAAARADKPAKRAVSQAPPPIKPVGGSATKSSIPLDELPFSEYRKIRDRQIKERYRR